MYGKIIQVIIAGSVGTVLLIFARWMIAKRIGKDVWEKEIKKENPSLKVHLVSTILVSGVAPFLEEAIFRGPLLLIFFAFSQWAWIGIFVFAGIFSLIHGKREKVFPMLQKEDSKTRKLINIFARINAFGLGVLAGWLVIKTQCLWWAILLHIVWPLAFSLLTALALLVYFLLEDIVKKIRTCWR